MASLPKRTDSLFKRSKSTDTYPTIKLDPITYNQQHLTIHHTSSPTSIVDSSQNWFNFKLEQNIPPLHKSPNHQTYLPPRSSSLSNPVSNDYATYILSPSPSEEKEVPQLKRTTTSTIESLEDAISTCSSYLTHTEEDVLLSPPKTPLKNIKTNHNQNNITNAKINNNNNNAGHNEEEDEEDEDDMIEPIELNDTIIKVDNDIEESLLHWKRKSNQTLSKPLDKIYFTSSSDNINNINNNDPSSTFNKDLVDMFSNTELWSEEAAIFGDIESILKKPSLQDQCQQTADQLWDDKQQQLISKKNMASFLGKNNLFNHTVLQLYLAKFDFTSLRIDEAFRLLCTKLYFKAEAQEIDRVLEGFAYRYWCCNRDSILLYNPDIVYAVVYSIMLLNTDLHIAQGSHHTKMSRNEFILNTMTTVNNNRNNNSNNDNPSERRVSDIENWNQSMKLYLKELYTSVKLHGILQPDSVKLTRGKSLLQRMGSVRKMVEQQNDNSVTKYYSDNSVSGNNQKLSHDIIDNPVMEGKIRYKTNDSKIKISNKHEWNDAWMVLHQRCLSLIIDKSSTIPQRIIRQTNQKWNGETSWELDLGHSTTARGTISTTTTTTTITNTTKGNHYFYLILNQGNIWYEFECETESELKLWIKHIQYWAAISTRIPLKAPISSDHFGWEDDILDNFHLLNSYAILKWESPHSSQPLSSSCSTPLSIDDIQNQHLWIKNHLISLQEEHRLHSALFSPINQIPIAFHNSKTLILSNWHEKNNHLIQEIEKYVTYNNAIQEYQQPNILDPNYSIGSFNLLDEISDSLKYLSVEK